MGDDREAELSNAFEKPVPLAQAVERSLRGMPASSAAGTIGQETSSFAQAIGGNSLLQDAHRILQNAKSTGRIGAPLRPSPERRRRSRSRRRGEGSYRSPTPDGKQRGQMRAARKAQL